MAKDNNGALPHGDSLKDEVEHVGDQKRPRAISLEMVLQLTLIVLCSTFLLYNQVQQEFSVSSEILKIKQHSAKYYKVAEKTKSLGYGLHALHKSKAEIGKLQEQTKSTADRLLRDMKKMKMQMVLFEGNVTNSLHRFTQSFLDLQNHIVPTSASNIQEFEHKRASVIWSKLEMLKDRLAAAFVMTDLQSTLRNTNIPSSDGPRLKDLRPHESMMQQEILTDLRPHESMINQEFQEANSDSKDSEDFHEGTDDSAFGATIYEDSSPFDPGHRAETILNLVGSGL